MKFGAFLLLLLAVGGTLGWLYWRDGSGRLRIRFGEEAEPRAAPGAPAGAGLRPAEPIAEGAAGPMPWVRDERWTRAVDAGEAGIALMELAYHEHFEVRGDPFLFRARKEEAGNLLAEAVAGLEALQAEWQHDAGALLDLEPALRKYRAGLEAAPRR